MAAVADKVISAELLDPQGDPTEIFFKAVELSEDQENAICADLFTLVKEASEARGDLDNMLSRWNDMAEGIASPKNFPWENSSNLWVPLTEIHLNNIHAAARQTMLKSDAMYYVRGVGIDNKLDVAVKLERYLNFKTQVELPLVDRYSQLIWCAERDGTVIAQIQWAVEKNKVKQVETFKTQPEFAERYPTPKDAGMTFETYRKVMNQLSGANPANLLLTKEAVTYKGPIVTVVQLSDFLMAPMTAVSTKYAKLVGKIFTLRGTELKRYEQFSDWKNVDDVIASKEDGRRDLSTSLKDDIEGISRRQGMGEFVLVDGIHRFDLDDDGVEESYLFVFHPQTKKLLMYMHYPYFNDKDCFIPIRLKKRPGRFLGRGLCQMLEDINSECNTQHNQRIDSRTITTVPTFKAKNSSKGKFDPSRRDTRFYPGNVFWLDALDDVVQFDIKQTDLSETMQEESTLFSLADQMTGSSQLRSGKETKQDPRAPAAKVMTLLNQSNVRLDDYFEEMAGSAVDNEGFNALGEFILELYYQFFDEDLAKIPALKDNLQPQTDDQGQPQQISMNREDFLVRNRMKVQMAKTSASQNPDAMLLKFMQVYSLLIGDPLVGGRPAGRLALERRLLLLSREENPDQYLPKDEQEAMQAMGIAQLLAQAQGNKPGGGENARKRGGQTKAGAPGAPGTTRPLG